MPLAMMGLRMKCLLLACTTILSCVEAYSVECSFGFSGVNCRENNTTQKILIGVGVVLSIIVVGGVLSCCCCGCCACCRSEPRHSTVVNTSATTVVPVNYSEPIQTYPQFHGYQRVPVQPFPAQQAMTAAPYSYPYVMANQNQGQPPSYQEAVPAQQPLCHSAGYPSHSPAKNVNDNLAFVDVAEPRK